MRRTGIRLFLILCLLFLPAVSLRAQELESAATVPDLEELLDIGSVTASTTTNDAGPVGIVPLTPGFNASINSSSQHDSSNGWSSLENVGIAYRFNQYFSVNASVPVYNHIIISLEGGTATKPTYTNVIRRFVFGDTTVTGTVEAHPSFFDYSLSSTLGLPSGNQPFGLGAGQPTYDFNNHFEKTISFLAPNIEIGFGDSSQLIGSRVRKSYTSVGPLSHFQAGISFALPFDMSFETDAYEELPVAPDTLYSTTGKGKKAITTVIGKSLSEDNGFTNALDIPLNGHLTLSGFYNRSLRSHDDVVGFSFTVLLIAPPRLPGVK